MVGISSIARVVALLLRQARSHVMRTCEEVCWVRCWGLMRFELWRAGIRTKVEPELSHSNASVVGAQHSGQGCQHTVKNGCRWRRCVDRILAGALFGGILFWPRCTTSRVRLRAFPMRDRLDSFCMLSHRCSTTRCHDAPAEKSKGSGREFDFCGFETMFATRVGLKRVLLSRGRTACSS